MHASRSTSPSTWPSSCAAPADVIRRLAIVGTGLIGASVGLAARRAGVECVRGFDLDPGALRAAAERGAVDVAAASVAEAVGGADLAIVAVPVGAVPGRVAEALAAVGEEGIVTDVGSTKSVVCAAAADDPRFIGGHPMAGGATPDADIFEGA